ncbi:hypothetical protein N8569_00750 [bacterium]|nr:hypothetical protein [bacterium]
MAMVVRKAAQIVKQSSLAEKAVAILLALLLALVINLNREVGTEAALRAAHEVDHPNVAIDVQLGEINETLKNMDSRLNDLEVFQVYGPPPPPR